MPTQKLNDEILQAALLGFEEQKKHIDQQTAEIRRMLAGEPKAPAPQPVAAPQPKKRKRRKLSAAGRAAIVAALKKRWATKKAASKPEPVPAKKTSAKKAAARKTIAKKVVKKAVAKKARKKVAKAPETAPTAATQ